VLVEQHSTRSDNRSAIQRDQDYIPGNLYNRQIQQLFQPVSAMKKVQARQG
jgi:hypothetical protein